MYGLLRYEAYCFGAAQVETELEAVCVQVLNRVSLAIAFVAVIGVVIILGSLLGRGDSPGYSVVIAFVILVSSVPVGMPVVTTTVLAVGAREMAKQKAIVNRQAHC